MYSTVPAHTCTAMDPYGLMTCGWLRMMCAHADGCGWMRMDADDVAHMLVHPDGYLLIPFGALMGQPCIYCSAYVRYCPCIRNRRAGAASGGGLHDPATASGVSYIARAHNARARPRATRARVHLGSPVLIPSVRCPAHRWLCLEALYRPV